jgi:hypothetical protein
VQTHCLRAQERCITFVSGLKEASSGEVYTFADGHWTNDLEAVARCAVDGSKTLSKSSVTIRMPHTVLSPFPALEGDGRFEAVLTGACRQPEAAFRFRAERVGD